MNICKLALWQGSIHHKISDSSSSSSSSSSKANGTQTGGCHWVTCLVTSVSGHRFDVLHLTGGPIDGGGISPEPLYPQYRPLLTKNVEPRRSWTTWARFPIGVRLFLFATASRPALEGRPASYPVGTGGSSPAREVHHTLPSSAEVKNAWSYTSTPPYVFMAWCLIKHGDGFTFVVVVV
jgi:hypothetical protein